MRPCKTLCIFTTLLGNKSMAQRLINALRGMEEIEPTFILLTTDDYQTYRAPRRARLSEPWEGRYIARSKANSVLDQQFEALLVNSWEFVTEFQDLARHLPAAALMDSLPATANAQLMNRGQRGWKRWVAHRLQHGPFKRAARHFRYFLPMGSDVVDSLEHHYGIPRERCFITPAPQDLRAWTPAERLYTPPLRLLFVGNDFLRKGGNFLLRLYGSYLRGQFTLTIASCDPVLESLPLPEGVTWLKGRNREQLLDVYRESDLFIFPTQQDYMPQVLAEALATGLPCIANDVGGIRDLVRDGQTGFLMSADAPLETWAERLRYLCAHPGELRQMAARARRFAEQNLGLDRFETSIRTVMERLRNNH